MSKLYAGEWTNVEPSGTATLTMTNLPGSASSQDFPNMGPGSAVRVTDSGTSQTSDTSNPVSDHCAYQKGSDGWQKIGSDQCPSGSACVTVGDINQRHPQGYNGQIIEVPCEHM